MTTFDAVMAYLIVGAMVWLMLDGLGIIRASLAARVAHGRVTEAGAVLATIFMICAWPVFVLAMVGGFFAGRR